MEKISFSDLYTSMRIQNLEFMVDTLCKELDSRPRAMCPFLPTAAPVFSIWPLAISIIIKLIFIVLCLFFMAQEFLNGVCYNSILVADIEPAEKEVSVPPPTPESS